MLHRRPIRLLSRDYLNLFIHFHLAALWTKRPLAHNHYLTTVTANGKTEDDKKERLRIVRLVLSEVNRLERELPDKFWNATARSIREGSWVMPTKTPSGNESYKRLKGNAGRCKTHAKMFWPELLVVQAIYPSNTTVKKVADEFSKEWRLTFGRTKASFLKMKDDKMRATGHLSDAALKRKRSLWDNDALDSGDTEGHNQHEVSQHVDHTSPESLVDSDVSMCYEQRDEESDET
ncbi:hypothetical protein ACJZ2D_013283 [Fusarium nematophilum]